MNHYPGSIQKYYTYNVSIEIMISFNQLMYHVDENNETVKLIVTLSNPSSADITVQVFSNDITATSKLILCHTFHHIHSYICGCIYTLHNNVSCTQMCFTD